jgi:DNA-binding winged helix-turn-helix (wHTH) protein/predicted ATPase
VKTSTPPWHFTPFRLDPTDGRLWRQDKEVPLRPKAFAVLCYLVEHAGRLVRRDELVQAVWGPTRVSEGVVRVCIRAIRRALGDEPQEPRFIDTVGRQGYRFIAPLTTSPSHVSSPEFRVPSSDTQPSILVGRESELVQLQHWLDKAAQDQRQIVFVTGEPGIGKTTLIDTFLRQAAVQTGVWVARGQCVEHYGPGEPYMPVLAAMEQLYRAGTADVLLDLLRRYAPLWLAQMPSFLGSAELPDLQGRVAGATRERMLREMATFLEALTVEATLVLALEDLHWSDLATMTLLAYLAQQREPARLLIVGSYRSADLTDEHPLHALVQECRVHGQSHDITLTGLSGPAVTQYVQERLAASGVPAQLSEVLYERTDGHPFFLASLIDELVREGILRVEDSRVMWQGELARLHARLPESVRDFFAQRRSRVTAEEEQVLMVASVAGLEFSSALVADVLALDIATVEERCEGLVRRRRFLRRAGISVWPDGTEAARYGFEHALCQQLWHEQSAPTRHRQWHRQLGERLERAYGEQTGEIAATLAVHFTEGRDYWRAAQYHRQAAVIAIRRSAPAEARQHVTTALALLKTLPDTQRRIQQELDLHIMLGTLQMATQGYAAPEMVQTYTRARGLCRQIGQPPQQLSYVLLGLFAFRLMRAELEQAYVLAQQLSTLTSSLQDPALCAEAYLALGATEFHRGAFVPAREHLRRGILLPPPQVPYAHLVDFSQDPWVACLCYDAFALAPLGYLDQARQRLQQAHDRAQALAHPFSLVFYLEFCCHNARFRGEPHAVYEYAQAFSALATEYGFRHREASGLIYRGWALAQQQQAEAGLEQIRRGLAAYRAVQATLIQPFFLAALAEAASRGCQIPEGLAAVAEGLELTQRTGERFYEAELHRLKGTLTLQQFQISGSKLQPSDTRCQGLGDQAETEAEACFRKAIEIARRQGAKLWELRATTSLARLWQQQGKTREAHQLLSAIYGWFTEGFDTKDLQEAKALLDELAEGH